MEKEIVAVTTFGVKGYEEYARESLELFAEHWPTKVIAFYEGDSPPNFSHEKIEYRPFFQIQGVPEFLTACSLLPALRGIRWDGVYDYNLDIFKFSRKVFAQVNVCLQHEGLVFWLDADVRLKKDVPEDFLRQLLEGVYTCYMGRPDRHPFYTETGFLGFDTTHPVNEKFMRTYEGLYKSGVVIELKGRHDCYVYDIIREQSFAPGRNLAEGTTGIHVMPQTCLHEYMYHLKGPRKSGQKLDPAEAK